MPRSFDELAEEIADFATSTVQCAGYSFDDDRMAESKKFLTYQVWWWLRDSVKEAHEEIG